MAEPNTLDGDKAAEGTEAGVSHDRAGNAVVSDKRMNEILSMFQSQLDSQKQQLDLLRGSVKSKEAKAPKRVPTLGDCERAVRWMERRGPKSLDLEGIGVQFISLCSGFEELWYSTAEARAKNAYFASQYRKCHPEDVYPQYSFESWLHEHWPRSLGVVGDTHFQWHERFEGSRWYFYNGDGHITEKDSERVNFESTYSCGWNKLRNKIERDGEGAVDHHVLGFGQIILLHFKDKPQISLTPIAFIALQLTLQYEEVSLFETYPTRMLLDSFVSDWTLRRDLFPLKQVECLIIPHVIRYFKHFSPDQDTSVIDRLHNARYFTIGDIPIIRERGAFYNATKSMASFLEERRVSLTLAVDDSNAFPCFTMIVLSDDALDPKKEEIEVECPFSSILLFIRLIDHAIQVACNSWVGVLRRLDVELSLKLGDLFDDVATEDLMFDDNSFKRSKSYFQLDQLCRIFSSSIEETIKDIKQTQSKSLSKIEKCFKGREGFASDFEALSVEWDKHTAAQIANLSVFLDQIRRKKEEVVSLRDGLFSASSVKEASKSTEMASISIRQNQYIFVFTVTTVIYLPLGFVTSIFGMHLFDTTDPRVVASQKKFWITIAALSVCTYVTAFVAYWLVRSRKDDLGRRGIQGRKVKEQGGQDKGVPKEIKGEKAVFGESLTNKGKGLGFFRWRGKKGQLSNDTAA